LRGTVTESVAATFTAAEISVPRDINNRLLFDIDEVRLHVAVPTKAVGADTYADALVQVVLSDDEPTAPLTFDNPKLLAQYYLRSIYDATDMIKLFQDPASPAHWETRNYANYIPDDKVWLVVDGFANTVALTATCKIIGSLAKVSLEDFQALVLSRL
ncbi:unnamed protein product, partial [marine sediment metagenome]